MQCVKRIAPSCIVTFPFKTHIVSHGSVLVSRVRQLLIKSLMLMKAAVTENVSLILQLSLWVLGKQATHVARKAPCFSHHSRFHHSFVQFHFATRVASCWRARRISLIWKLEPLFYAGTSAHRLQISTFVGEQNKHYLLYIQLTHSFHKATRKRT
jgi:hypothetical protein